MKRKHRMPFGAECRDDGSVRFRLWAPKCKTVSLRLPDLERTQGMQPADDGWFEVTQQVVAGTCYVFQIDDAQLVPDPASRFQPSGVHDPSQIVDPAAFEWQDKSWNGRPWEEAVIYELHVGTFTPEGTFAAAEEKLGYLADLGITAVELMPVADFPGNRDWGYDGVLPYAPARCYGHPEDLKRFIQSAHQHGLMVLLDVVYNHFGPEGNYLWCYAPEFFTERHHTPWGAAINFDGLHSRAVREFFIHNALYWLEEFHFDGLRLDAVHAIKDDSRPDILTDLAQRVRSEIPGRHIHLVLENDDNAARYLGRGSDGCVKLYDAQWNDDIHHSLHVLLTGETDGYYADYARKPAWHLGRCLAEGFSFQGEKSDYRDGTNRGEASGDLPTIAFVSFLQNHDQVGNRAFGERIVQCAGVRAVKAAMAVLLLAPSPPLLFMGEEFGAETPFLFFCDFGPELAPKVTSGRRSEFARFAKFSSPEAQSNIPDPASEATFQASRLNWDSLQADAHQDWINFYRDLLRIRREAIVPRIPPVRRRARFELLAPGALQVSWKMKDASNLLLLANFAKEQSIEIPRVTGEMIYETDNGAAAGSATMAPLSVAWFLQT